MRTSLWIIAPLLLLLSTPATALTQVRLRKVECHYLKNKLVLPLKGLRYEGGAVRCFVHLRVSKKARKTAAKLKLTLTQKGESVNKTKERKISLEQRTLVALAMGEMDRVRHHLGETEYWFRITENPALVARYEKLAAKVGEHVRARHAIEGQTGEEAINDATIRRVVS